MGFEEKSGVYVCCGRTVLSDKTLGTHLKKASCMPRIESDYNDNDIFYSAKGQTQLLGELINVTYTEENRFTHKGTGEFVSEGIKMQILIQDGANRIQHREQVARKRAKLEEKKLEDYTIKELKEMSKISSETRMKIQYFLQRVI